MTGISSDYMAAVQAEARKVGMSSTPIHVKTIYFGGGTPSLINPREYSLLMEVLHNHYMILDPVEISLEANPGTVSKTYLSELISIGINRLSLGMQSSQPKSLRLLGRTHTLSDVENAVVWAREAGFKNISLDLIYGIPGQSLEDWKHTLNFAVGLSPDHLSLYSLTLENEVPMQKWIRAGKTPAQDHDLMAEQYEWSLDYLMENGYIHYEISNWARADEKNGALCCEHNMQYWMNEPYLGIGAGAHGYANGLRTENVRGIPEYIRRCSQGTAGKFPAGPAVQQTSAINPFMEMQETMMMGMRLIEIGVSKERFFKRFNVDVESVFGTELKYLEDLRLIEYAGEKNETIRLTRKGYLLGNQVFMQFVG